jgi:hypothetical protein
LPGRGKPVLTKVERDIRGRCDTYVMTQYSSLSGPPPFSLPVRIDMPAVVFWYFEHEKEVKEPISGNHQLDWYQVFDEIKSNIVREEG